MKTWLGVFQGKFFTPGRASAQLVFHRENHCSIGITDVPLGSLCRIRIWSFGQLVLLTNEPIFSQSPARAPTAVRNAKRYCNIQSGSVRAGLSARNDLFDYRAHRRPILFFTKRIMIDELQAAAKAFGV